MFFDLPEAGERALLVHCEIDSRAQPGRSFAGEDDPLVEEFVDLVKSAGVTPVCLDVSRRKFPVSGQFIGSGKVAELADIVSEHCIDVVLFNHQLSPSQERNLEKVFKCRVIDRTGLILDIFAQRARSHAGKLQVELAQLQYISTRLVRGWTHLERQKGGIGLRGPGESQLETDRRLLRERVKWIRQRLAKVHQQRQQGRRARKRAEVSTIALVGYTNAGKSTLFNALCDSDVYAEDQLFATLDTTLRALNVPGAGDAVLADTVGFVRELPHKLVEAFKATLEEATEADLLLHVVDASSEELEEQILAVNEVLDSIGAADIPVLLVMNKIDALDQYDLPGSETFTTAPGSKRLWVSARTGAGIGSLMEAIAEALVGAIWRGEVALPAKYARLRAKLYEMGAVEHEQISDDGFFHLGLRFRPADLRRQFDAAGCAELLGCSL